MLTPKRAQCCVTGTLPQLIGPVIAEHLGRDLDRLPDAAASDPPRTGDVQHRDQARHLVWAWPMGASFNPSVDHDFLVVSARKLVQLFPCLSDARLLRSWGACEVWTPDQRFLIGAVGPQDGLFIAAGDNGVGFLNAPMVARSFGVADRR